MSTVQTTTPPSPSGSAAEGELLQWVSFVVGDEYFAIPILSVREINRTMPITRVPQSPEFIEGVVNLRGRIIPVMDLRRRFGLPAAEESADARIIIVEVESGGDRSRVIGFTVDRVDQVLGVHESAVEPPPAAIGGVADAPGGDYVRGVAKLEDRLLILLDLERLLGSASIAAAEQLAPAA